MIVSFAAFLAGAAVQPPPAALSTDKLPETFAAACLDGSVALSPGQASAIPFKELPRPLRQRLGKPASGQIWRLNSEGRAYLYVLEYKPGPTVSPKVCGIAAEAMEFGSARKLLESRVDPDPLHLTPTRSSEWLRPVDGFVAIATTVGNFSVLQIRWLNDKQRDRMLFDLRQAGADLPESTPSKTENQ